MQADLTPLGNLLDANLLTDVITEFAMTVRWYPARRCDCWGDIDKVQEASGSPDPYCPTCGGLGRTYPTYHDVTGVLLDGMENLAAWNAESGVNYLGQIRMTVPAIIQGQSVDLYTQGTLNDLIWAEDIVLTTRNVIMRGVDATREWPIGSLSITQGATTYTLNVDYRVNGRNIEWLSSGPASGSHYEATFQYHPWFSIMQGMAIARNMSHLNLPRLFVLQLTPDFGEDFSA